MKSISIDEVVKISGGECDCYCYFYGVDGFRVRLRNVGIRFSKEECSKGCKKPYYNDSKCFYTDAV